MERRRMLAGAVVGMLTAMVIGAQKAPQFLEEKYDSGKLKARYSLGADGAKNGSFQLFYEDGKVQETGDYLHGELNGRCFSFHSNGQRAVTCAYDKGALEGDWTAFDENGRTSATGVYHAGKKSGLFREFAGDKVASEEFFVEDELILPRSAATIVAKLGEIQKTKVATVAAPEGVVIPAHRGEKQSEEDREAGVRRLMEYRYLCNVPFDISLDAVYNAHDEAAASLLVANGKLDHHPPNPGWSEEEYKFAEEGTGSSNLFERRPGPPRPADAVQGFMDDGDESNIDRLGHRRWCLNPGMAKTGFGVAGVFVAMWSFDRTRADVPDYEYVAFPSSGLFPVTHFKADWPWSISLNPQKYRDPAEKKIHVSVKPAQLVARPAAVRVGGELKLNYLHVDTQGFGIPNAIIFRFPRCQVQAGSAYQVEVSGLETAEGAAATVKYVVEFFVPPK